MVGRIEKYLVDKIEKEGAVHITLIDPENVTPSSVSSIVREAESCQTDSIMVGGSTFVSTSHLDRIVKAIKESVKIPVILFPNNVTGISKHADAIWFMSLLNSSDPYFLMGAQVLGAPIIKRLDLEPIPLGYIIVGQASTVAVVGKAVPIPYDKPELAATHALAAKYFGMRFIYLEAGSGAKQPVPNEMIRVVKTEVTIPLIVGGGIRTGEQVRQIIRAGADIIVTGTIVEEGKRGKKIRELIETIKRYGKLSKGN